MLFIFTHVYVNILLNQLGESRNKHDIITIATTAIAIANIGSITNYDNPFKSKRYFTNFLLLFSIYKLPDKRIDTVNCNMSILFDI